MCWTTGYPLDLPSPIKCLEREKWFLATKTWKSRYLCMNPCTCRHRWSFKLLNHLLLIWFRQLFYTPDSLEPYVGLSYDEQVDPAKHEGIKPDNVLKILGEYIPKGIFQLSRKLRRLEEEKKWSGTHGMCMHQCSSKSWGSKYACILPWFGTVHIRLLLRVLLTSSDQAL